MADSIPPLTEILAAHGPLSEDDVVQRLQDAGAVDAEDLFWELIDESGSAVGQLIDHRWILLPPLLAGRVFTHRLTADEVAHDILTVTPDLVPVTNLSEDDQYARFADGSPARVALPTFDNELFEERDIPLESVDPVGALLLASGTLTALGVCEGDLVGVRLTVEGLAVEPVTTIADAAVGARFAAMLEADEPTYFESVVWTACAEDSQLFTQPLAPLSEIVDAAGLERDVDWLAPAGFDIDRWRFNLGSARLIRNYDLDVDDAAALNALLNMHARMAREIDSADSDEPVDGPPWGDDLAALGGALADPRLAMILLIEATGAGRAHAGTLGLFAEALEPKVPRPARVACRWLRAIALERTGDAEQAEQELLVAESMDTDWAPTLFDLARFASDRGDAERGLSLLRRAGATPDDPMVVLLERHRAMPRSDLGRNDACWCGSGRKYKKCHLGREQLPLAQRADWLYNKAVGYALLSGWEELFDEVDLERTQYFDDDVAADWDDPLVMDAVLFEGGAFEEFLAARGALLPEDERALAEQWLLAERSVFEVEDVRRGKGMTVRDIRTGDRHEVSERAGSGQLKPGHLICARVVPVGDTVQIFGGIEPVGLHERDSLIAVLDAEPDPVELVAYLSRRFAPPTLTNTEGDPMAICEATVRVGDPDGIVAALDDTYDRVEDEDPPQWLEHVTTQGMSRIRATLAFDGETLRVNTNSEKRVDRVLSTVARVDPGMTVLDDTRRPVRDTREAAELAEHLPTGRGPTLDPNDPAVAAALKEFIREYETKWLDEPIPALDGHTPREGAADPTRRDDLIKLLDSFPTGAAARDGMDADRLRAALGLE